MQREMLTWTWAYGAPLAGALGTVAKASGKVLKTMANGVPISALVGKKKIMEEAKNSFISSTNWTERLGPACAVEFLKKHKRLNLGKILAEKGEKIRNIWIGAASKAGISYQQNLNNGPECLAKFNLPTQTNEKLILVN